MQCYCPEMAGITGTRTSKIYFVNILMDFKLTDLYSDFDYFSRGLLAVQQTLVHPFKLPSRYFL